MSKLKRLSARYKQLNSRREGQDVNTQMLPKSKRVSEIQYVFVIFKNCETRNVVLEQLEAENNVVKFLKQFFCIATKKTKDSQFLMGKKIQVEPIIEPDEILWENLSFSMEEQFVRKLTMQIVALIFILIATMASFYMAGFDSLVR
mmetsp:Transcript_24596/g.38192  ORF Transcript_24596/g.38192 Transcript_24596/m.38192 type:complete len:146 (-) Transcript_24596:2569-3006(-)